MVDTVRTLAALQALLPDNTAGDIAPQDHRDELISVYTGRVFAAHAAPPSSGWSWVNQGTATVGDLATGAVLLSVPATGANNLIARVRSISDPVVATAQMDGLTFLSASAGVGVVATQVATGTRMVAAYMTRGGTITVENWTSPTAFSSQVATGIIPNIDPLWWQIEDNSTNLIFRVSANGAPGSYIDVYSASRTTWLETTGPTEFGWVVRDHSQIYRSVLYSWSEA